MQGYLSASLRFAIALVVAVTLLAASAAAASNYAFEARLSGSDSLAGDLFGTTLAISGDVAVVGAPNANTPAGAHAGAAYVFVRSGSTWTQQQKLVAADATPNQNFGFSVALEGDTLVVGAPSAVNQDGAAYVFVRAGATWMLQQKLVPVPAYSQAGYSVSLSGDTVAMGAPGDAFIDGTVYVFARSGSNWTQQQVGLARTGILPGSPVQFGRSTSISGDTLIVGEEAGPKQGGGMASVFLRSGQTWSPQQYILPPQDPLGDFYFGFSVSVSGDTAAVGTLFDGIESGDEAFVFVRSGSLWTLQQQITSPDVQPGDDFGSVLVAAGDSLVVGAPVSNFLSVSRPGAGYLFARSGANWVQQQRFSDPAGADGDHFGASTALSGRVVGFGSPAANAAVLYRGIDADLGVTIDDGQAAAVPGMPVSYLIVVSNAGPDAASATVSATSSALLGVSWTCSASQGSSCTPSGAGALADSVDLAAGGSAFYTLTGTVDPAATGMLVSNATVALPPGLDPNPGNDSATDTDSLTPVADLAVGKSDGQSVAVPGQPIAYMITVANIGPSDAVGALVSDLVPPTLQATTWTCSASPGSSCTASGNGNINDTATALVGGTLAYALSGTLSPTATGALTNTATVTPGSGATDPALANNSATDVDALPVGFPTAGELVHGYDQQHDLAALPGPTPKQDVFRIFQNRHTSCEVLVDGVSGDLGADGPLVERLAPDASTVIQSSVPAGAGGSRSLRWMNALDQPVADEFVRVESAGCTTDCNATDAYRVHARETTGFISRFNNSGTQLTVLVLENQGSEAMDLDIRFWGQDGGPLGGASASVGPQVAYVLDTSTLVPGTSGSISVANSGRYGQLAGKAVAVEPGTGFTFDTPLTLRPR